MDLFTDLKNLKILNLSLCKQITDRSLKVITGEFNVCDCLSVLAVLFYIPCLSVLMYIVYECALLLCGRVLTGICACTHIIFTCSVSLFQRFLF